eukprot:scaffold156046_cov29-Tisochrysis_lutea.AAC.2
MCRKEGSPLSLTRKVEVNGVENHGCSWIAAREKRCGCGVRVAPCNDDEVIRVSRVGVRR